MKNFLKNKMGNAVTLIMLFPILMATLFLIIYEIDMTKCSNAVEDTARVCISLAKSSSSYDDALQNVINFCEKEGKFASITPNNLNVISTSGESEIKMNKNSDNFDPSCWHNGAVIELTLTKYSDYYGASAFKFCKLGSNNCATIVSTAKTATIRGYVYIS